MIITDKKKQEIEKYLLLSMKNLDRANGMIGWGEEYSKEYYEIKESIATIKRVLNRHFDQCARNKSNSSTPKSNT